MSEPISAWRRLAKALRIAGGALAAFSVCVVAASWYFTEPLHERVPATAETPATALPSAAVPSPEPAASRSLPEWPDQRLAGLDAKRILMDTVLAVGERLRGEAGYTAIFHKRERIKGKLGEDQVMEMKARNRPFAVYFKFLNPTPGKEVVYAEGHRDGKVLAHGVGLARFLVPRLAVAPDSPIALADSRHPVTDAGLLNLTERLIAYRKLDLIQPEAETILDRVPGPDGRDWPRSVHLHHARTPDRLFARVEILYDPETRIPLSISNYDWPAPGKGDETPLAERYAYEALNFDVTLTDLDFDPANPAYQFHR
ncbi:DUF1571 domain-containing protein [Isosphaeraceae bacterium EP7]